MAGALLFPPTLPPVRLTGGMRREMDVIQRLAEALPAGFEIFHHVHFHQADVEGDRHGEVDLIVLSPRGTLLLIEVKAGPLESRAGRLFKSYQDGDTDVEKQLAYQWQALRNRLKATGLDPYVTYCLVAPDWALASAGTVSLPPKRIIDSTGYDILGTRVRELLASGRDCSRLDALRQFLRNEFEVLPDLTALRDQLHRHVRALGDGLATWVPRMKAPSGVIQIQATAGSGKTQLALRLLEDAHAAGASARYVCFNRPLADRLLTIAPDPDCVITFHELCVDHYRRLHGEPDFTRPEIFTDAANEYLAASSELPKRFALIVIDEAQDFEPEWVKALAAQLQPDGQLVTLTDDDQRLYERESWEVPDAVTIEAWDNFRSPRRICEVINAFGLTSRPIRSLCPYPGELPEITVYDGDNGLLTATANAVDRLLSRGFRIGDIAVITGRGLRKSRLLGEDRIGSHSVRRFTGNYDRAGNPVYTNGELLAESVYRFKGQSAPAVVLSEFDFATLGEMERRKLFVGLTRAQMAVHLVISVQTDSALKATLCGAL